MAARGGRQASSLRAGTAEEGKSLAGDAAAVPARIVLVGMGFGYVLGLAGWIWEGLAPAGVVDSGRGAAPGFVLMSLGTLAVLPALVVALRRFVGRRVAYQYFAVGLVSFFVHPLASSLAFLAIGLSAAWLYRRGKGGARWFAVAASGMAIIQVGMAADWVWHRAFLGIDGSNIVLVPGHAVQLLGWVVGLGATASALLEGSDVAGQVNIASDSEGD